MLRNILLSISVILLASCSSKNMSDPDCKASYELAERVLGNQAKHFTFEKLEGIEGDVFELSSDGSDIIIKGTNANSMAVGLNHYLRY